MFPHVSKKGFDPFSFSICIEVACSFPSSLHVQLCMRVLIEKLVNMITSTWRPGWSEKRRIIRDPEFSEFIYFLDILLF